MFELLGVLAGVLSSALGGIAVGSVDPITLGALRFGIGAFILIPCALFVARTWPRGRELAMMIAIGFGLFGLYPLLFNAALVYTTAARGSIVLSLLPVLTMLLGAALGIEQMRFNRVVGVTLTTAGVATVVLQKAGAAAPDAWLGDLLMFIGAFCMAGLNIASKTVVKKYGTLTYTTIAMAAGAVMLSALAAFAGRGMPSLADHTAWFAVGYLGAIGGAVMFLLWSYAIKHASPTQVAVSITVNPMTSAIFGTAVLGEPITLNLIIGLGLVATGIVLTAWRVTSVGRA